MLSGAFVRTPPQTTPQRLAGWLVARSPLGRRIWGSYIPRLYGHRTPGFDDHLSKVRANLAEPGRFAAVAAMAGADHDAAEAALPDVTPPALVIMGSADPDFVDPTEEARLTAERLGGPARVIMVDGAGHYPHAEDPDIVTPVVIDFLATSEELRCHGPD